MHMYKKLECTYEHAYVCICMLGTYICRLIKWYYDNEFDSTAQMCVYMYSDFIQMLVEKNIKLCMYIHVCDTYVHMYIYIFYVIIVIILNLLL